MMTAPFQGCSTIWFVIPLSAEVHREYHRGPKTWAAKYGSHQDLLKAFWKSIGFEPGDFMTVGMPEKRAAWLERVLEKLMESKRCT